MRAAGLAQLRSLCALFCLAACGCDANESEGVATSTLVAWDTVVTTASELIGGAVDMVIGPDSRVYLSDYQYNHILTVLPDGTDPRTIGRAGAGPGEFRTPWSIAVSAESLWVYDMGNGRVQVLDRSGAYAGHYAAPLPPFGGGRALNSLGQLAAGTGGRDSALVAVLTGRAEARTVGRAVAPPVTGFDFGRIRERILAGEIPDEYRNDVLPVWGEDEALFVAFYSEPEVRCYGSDGDVRWTRVLADPVLESLRTAFVRKNRENTDPGRLFPLRYVVDGQAVGNELWLLLNTENEPDGVVLVLDGENGRLKRRVVLTGLPNVGPFAVDPARDRLYVVARDEAMLLALGLQ